MTLFLTRCLLLVLAVGCAMMDSGRGVLGQPAGSARKVVFFGDSITEAGAADSGYIGRLRKHFPGDSGVELIGAGISGHRVPDLQQRLERDVLVHHPDLVVVYIGINDVWHSQHGRGTPRDEFEAGLRDLLGRIQAGGSRTILCTPSVIGEKTDGSNPLDAMLEEYSETSRKVARETGSLLVDLRKMFLRELAIANPGNLENGILTPDGVHLNDEGNQFVADCLRPAIQSVLQGGPVRHVVLFQFKATARQADINRVCDAFSALPEKIPVVRGFEAGTDVSPEQLARGYTHCFFLTFDTPADRDAYLVHPAHAEFVELIRPSLESALVVDYLGK